MSAKGFGTLKAQTHQDVTAKGIYANGTWKVVFSRLLTTEHPNEDMQLKPGEFINIAFAVWDGRKDGAGDLVEKGSQKAVSSWWYFRAEAPPGLFRVHLCRAGHGRRAGLSVRVDSQTEERAVNMKAANLRVLGAVLGIAGIWGLWPAGAPASRKSGARNCTPIIACTVTARTAARTKDSTGPRCPIPSRRTCPTNPR